MPPVPLFLPVPPAVAHLPDWLRAADAPARDVRGRCLRLALKAARAAGRRGLHAIAADLGVSVGELVAAHAGAFPCSESPLRAQRLQPVWPALVAALPAIGCVRIETGSQSASLRLHGEHPGLALAAHWAAWTQAYVLTERQADGAARRSLQVFDAAGRGLHTVTLGAGSCVAALHDLVERWGSTHGAGRFPRSVAPRHQPGAAAVAAGLETAAPPQRTDAWADELDPGALPELLHRAAQTGLALRVGVGNDGLWQTAVLRPQRLSREAGGWRLDGFGTRLRWRDDPATPLRVLRHASRHGLRHTLLLHQTDGRPLLAAWPETGRDRPEPCVWREWLQGGSPGSSDVTGGRDA